MLPACTGQPPSLARTLTKANEYIGVPPFLHRRSPIQASSLEPRGQARRTTCLSVLRPSFESEVRVLRNDLAGGSLDVLLTDGQQRQTLACAREYTRRGLRAGVTACEEDYRSAAALWSRSCAVAALTSNVSQAPGEFIDSLLSLVRRYSPQVLVPGHDGTIEALRSRREEVGREVALAMAPEAALAIAVDKRATMRLATTLGIATPETADLESADDIESALAQVGTPAVLKPGHSWNGRRGRGMRLTGTVVRTVAEAHAAREHFEEYGAAAHLQRWVPGRRDAVSIFMADGQIVASFAQTSHREFPVHGGVSTLCESIAPPDDILMAAQSLVQAIGLEGCSMVEFRRDAAGVPVLMEVNPRMAGSVALAIRCGVDFADLAYRWALGEPLEPVDGYRTGVRLRWLPGDIWHLKTAFGARGPDVPSRSAALARFFGDFVMRRAMIDGIARNDLHPSLVEWRQHVLAPLAGRMRRLGRARSG